MRKILAIGIICVFLLTGFTTASAVEVKTINKVDDKNVESENYVKDAGYDFGNYSVYIRGPVSKIYTDIKLINTSFLQKKLIERNLNRRLLRLSILLPTVIIPAKNIDLTIIFMKNIGNSSRISYNTTIWKNIYDENGKLVNLTLEQTKKNEIHIIKIQNFTGIFMFQRVKLFSLREKMDSKILRQARFIFNGWCEGYTFV